MPLSSHAVELSHPLEGDLDGAVRAQARIRVVRLLLITYVLLIIEGGLRKWALESIQMAVFFIRDPCMVAIYAIAWQHRLVPRTPLFTLLMIMLAGFVCLAGLQVAILNLNPMIAGFGLRSYFLTIWLVPVMAAVMTRRDILNFINLTLIIAIPMAVLSFFQWRSPVNSYINKGIGNNGVFTVVDGVVRTTGTFSFTAGFVCFTGSLIACLAAYGFSRSRRVLKLLAGLVASAICLATCGSRSAFVSAAITGLAVVLSEVFRPIAKQRPIVYLVVIAMPLAFGVGFVVAFPDAIAMMLARQESANQSEDPVMRLIYTLLDGFRVMEEAGPLGVGIGFGTNGGAIIGTGSQHFTLAEVEFTRVVQECGMIMGMAYMFLRGGLCLWMFVQSVRCIRQRDDALALMLLSFTVPQLLIGQITGQGTINGYGWTFAGLTMAAIATSTSVGTADDA